MPKCSGPQMHQEPRCRDSCWSYDCHVLTARLRLPPHFSPQSATHSPSPRGLPTSISGKNIQRGALGSSAPTALSLRPYPTPPPSPHLSRGKWPQTQTLSLMLLFLTCCTQPSRVFWPLRSQYKFWICSLPCTLGQATVIPMGWLQGCSPPASVSSLGLLTCGCRGAPEG